MYVETSKLILVNFYMKLEQMERGKKRERRELSKYLGIREFTDLHKGSKCFICGAGPSLKDLDLSVIKEYPSISVNSSIIAMPWEEETDAQKSGGFVKFIIRFLIISIIIVAVILALGKLGIFR